MCGIIGINAKSSNVVTSVITGLKNLEYRGYDSAGITAIIDNKLKTVKVKGKINILEQEAVTQKFKANIAIGHTRWATHGAANQINAHPHQTEQVSVVHNGIIENFLQIKYELTNLGHKFSSQTDSEVIPHLITYFLNQGEAPLDAVNKTIERLEGAFSIAVIFLEYQDIIIAARKGSPLVIGHGEDQMTIASDAYALAFLTNKISYLEEGDVAVLYTNKIEIYNSKRQAVKRDIITIDNSAANISKGNFRHYMLKEIFQQPGILADTINAYYDAASEQLNFSNLKINFKSITKISLIACGTSYYAAMVAKYWLEKLVSLPIEIDIASEFRYRDSYLPENGLCIFLSQSGETADTLAAMRYAKQKGQITLSIVNVKESSLDRESDFSLQCFAGLEISVASTKGFTTQLSVLLLLSLHISHQMDQLSKTQLLKNLQLVTEIPGRIAEVLSNAEAIKTIAKEVALAKNVMFIGRNYIYPIALEGALKLKELSYIHAEAIAAGELKHGPIALIDENVPIIVLAPQNYLFEKTSSNAQEVAARGGKLITISSAEGNLILHNLSEHQLNISATHSLIEPIIYAIPMQLLAYYVAVIKGTDVDQPRNLAKSVTVE